MVAEVSNTTASTTPNPKVNYQNAKRQPLLPSEAENNAPPRRPKSREVTSRYLSSSSLSSSSISNSTSTTTASSNTYSSSSSSRSISSRRSQSPLVTRTAVAANSPATNLSTIKRSQSVERRRATTSMPTPVSTAEISTTARLLMTSTRSLSVSFQGESFSLPVSKAKPAPTPAVASNLSSLRKGTPERRKAATPAKDQTENSRITDQHRWPGRSKPISSSILNKRLDYGTDKSKLTGSVSVIRGLQRSMMDENNKIKKEAKLKDETGNIELRNKAELADDANSALVSTKSADAAGSDSESVSSESSSGANMAQIRGGRRGIVVPARFWHETNSKLRKAAEPASVSPVSLKNNRLKTMTPSKRIGEKEFLNESPVSSPKGVSASRGFPSPLRGGMRPASPSKALTPSIHTPGRGMPSPTRMRNGIASVSSKNAYDAPSILSFAADVRRGKVGQNQVVDAHELKLLYNRHLQWRFANARAEAALSLQTETAERSLYNAWVTTSKLRHSVKSKRIQLQLLRQNLKLYSILKGQVPYLESWDLIDADHSSSLSGAKEALEASVVRLPLLGGARADIQHVNNAICSAADVMRAMASSVCSQVTKVEQVNSLASELTNIVADERALLDQCKDQLLSALTAMQVNDCSLRTHILQQKRESSSLETQL